MSLFNRKYQVFISSTFRDLSEERREVMQVLLEMNCIPAGMELFPASDDAAWPLIQRVIDDCDYYVVIVANRYGSVDADGLSYTEKEFAYAVAKGIPVLPFLHADPESIPARDSEMQPELQAKLEAFRNRLKERHCKFYTSASDLASKVGRALIHAFQSHERPGWVRGGDAADPMLVTKLKDEIEGLRQELERARTKAPAGTEGLAQGSDLYELQMESFMQPTEVITMTWADLFGRVGPTLLGTASESVMRAALDAQLRAFTRFGRGSIRDVDFDAIKLQLRALGLTRISDRKRSLKDNDTYWELTPYGETVLNQLRAIPKGQTQAIVYDFPEEIEEEES